MLITIQIIKNIALVSKSAQSMLGGIIAGNGIALAWLSIGRIARKWMKNIELNSPSD
jgi:hypothetical protein